MDEARSCEASHGNPYAGTQPETADTDKGKPNAKPFVIPKALIWAAYKRVKANRGGEGVDGVSLARFDEDWEGNLYKLWNRMASGSYFPPPVRLVEIPKGGGGLRPLGIPTVSDRIAQTAVRMALEPLVEPVFHEDSYAYRPGKSALDAVATARQRCWRYDWVVDLDVKSFFDTIPPDLILRTVRHHTDRRWVHLYIERWLHAPLQRPDGTLEARLLGTPQGSAISPLLANLFMHYAFDAWMTRTHPTVPFERYADDALIHCRSLAEAEVVLAAVRDRLAACGLVLHSEKTRIVYCHDGCRPRKTDCMSFDFLGFTFRARSAQSRGGKPFTGFLPAVSNKSSKSIRSTMRSWRLAAKRSNWTLSALADFVNPIVRGWIAYYGRFYPSWLARVLGHLDRLLVQWARRKFKRLRTRLSATYRWLGRVAQREPNLFAHWQFGSRPSAG